MKATAAGETSPELLTETIGANFERTVAAYAERGDPGQHQPGLSHPCAGLRAQPVGRAVSDPGISLLELQAFLAKNLLDPEDPINIQYTSGTTGFPNGATASGW